jgi:hypothetical protein
MQSEDREEQLANASESIRSSFESDSKPTSQSDEQNEKEFEDRT